MLPEKQIKFALATLLLGTALLHGIVFWMAEPHALEGYPDFSIFYTAGLIARRGQAAQLYDHRLQRQTRSEFAPAALAKEEPLPYNHPPFEALLFVPLSYVSYPMAYRLWALVNLLLLTVSLWALRPQLEGLSSKPPWLPYLATFSFFSIALALIQGQDSILLLSLYCLAFVALQSGKDFRAGALLGLGLFKFQFVLPFAFVLLMRRRWRALEGILASGAFVLAVSLAMVGREGLLYYPHYVWEINRRAAKGVIVPSEMPTLRGLIAGWNGGHNESMWGSAIILALSLLLLVWAARQWDASDLERGQTWQRGFSLCVVATFLVSYHGYSQDMSILFLPLLLLFDQLVGRSVLQDVRRDARRDALEGFLLLIFCNPFCMIVYLHYGHQNLFAVVLLTLAASLAAWHRPRPGLRESRLTPTI